MAGIKNGRTESPALFSLNVRLRHILLKNSNFRIDHNSGDR
jgi:hypothetical protein